MGDEALRQRREARAARHRQVERQQVGLVLADRADRGGHVAGFGHDAELARLALEHHADAVANDPVIVRDDHVDRSIDPWCASLHRAHSTACTGGSRPWVAPSTRRGASGARRRESGLRSRRSARLDPTWPACALDGPEGLHRSAPLGLHDRHLPPTDKSPARPHHVGYAAQAPTRCPATRKESHA